MGTSLQKGVLNGMSPPLIARDRMTVASFLHEHGYQTAMIGKWHLGLTLGESPWKDEIVDGPCDHGFDQFFGISASLDMPPFVFIENRRVTEEPTAEKKWVRSGPAGPLFEAIDVLPTLTERAEEFIASYDPRSHADLVLPIEGGPKLSISRAPFFLYLALMAPHTPVLPTAEWKGKSGVNDYGDFVMQVDAAVGKVLDAIDAAHLTDDTIVIFTSDNGCSPAAKVEELEAAGHFASGEFRGYKADIWEGGHRVPYVVRWPGRVAADSRCDGVVCLTDFFATCADVLGESLPETAAVDSFSMLPLLEGRTLEATRESVVHHSIDGCFAIRRGPWKLRCVLVRAVGPRRVMRRRLRRVCRRSSFTILRGILRSSTMRRRPTPKWWRN